MEDGVYPEHKITMAKLLGSFLAVSVFSVSWITPALLRAEGTTPVPIQGSVQQLADGTPICAMVLANGQYMFSCDGAGSYNLTVPLDENGEITLFSFADGFAPFRVTNNPGNLPSTILMQPAAPNSPSIDVSSEVVYSNVPNRVRISGDLWSAVDGTPVCGLALANGQHMFSCDEHLGYYDLTVPADEKGQVTLFAFADGFQPYSQILDGNPLHTFYVYRDFASEENHFVPSGWMGDLSAISIDDNWTSDCYSEPSCIRLGFQGSQGNWAGIYWQNPENNWGQVPDAGFDLSGCATLTFRARGATGNEKVDFFSGGIGIDQKTNTANMPYPDSTPAIIGRFTLTNTWRHYSLDLVGHDLSYMIGGFGWATASDDNPQGATFFIDEMKYLCLRPPSD